VLICEETLRTGQCRLRLIDFAGQPGKAKRAAPLKGTEQVGRADAPRSPRMDAEQTCGAAYS
jgi:hypothetical protein